MIPLATDQKNCYDAAGEIVPCEGTGQDGEKKTGGFVPQERFSVNEKTAVDQATGLEWTLDASIAEFPLDWNEAFEFVRNMSKKKTFGHADWRLPSRRELFSLVSHTAINPALPENHPFVAPFSGYYWTSDSCARLSNQAWYIHLGGARVQRGMKHGSYMVWPVRTAKGKRDVFFSNGHMTAFYKSREKASGREESLSERGPQPGSRFVDQGEAVLDRMTGLQWRRNADLANGQVDWSKALKIIAELNNKTSTSVEKPWRLANVRELESICDIDRHTPALAEGHPFENVRPFYWSSTTSAYDPCYAWASYMQDGAVGVGYKPDAEFFVWAVRG